MKYAKYFALEKRMKAAGMPVDRAEIIADFTEGRTESLRELTTTEYRELINHMSTLVGEAEFNDSPANRMRKKVIAILCQCGYTKNDKPDMKAINNWCITRGHGKKELNEYDLKGLQKLIHQAEQMQQKIIERL